MGQIKNIKLHIVTDIKVKESVFTWSDVERYLEHNQPLSAVFRSACSTNAYPRSRNRGSGSLSGRYKTQTRTKGSRCFVSLGDSHSLCHFGGLSRKERSWNLGGV